MTGTLTSRTASGFGWMLLGGGGQLVAQVVVVGVLARLVTPEEFGVVAAALVVVNMLQIVADAGIGPALVQRTSITQAHIRVGYTLTLGLAVVLWLGTVATAPLLASLLEVPEVATVIPALCASLILTNATLGDYLLSRDLKFRKIAMVEFGSYLVGYGVIAIALALAGAGVWSIVAGQVGQALVRLIALWRVRPHSRKLMFRREEARELLGYGTGHVLAKAGHFVATQADNVVVARVLGASALGLYSRAYQFMTLPGLVFGRVVDRVLFPAMAAVQTETERLAGAWLRGLTLVGVVVLPLTGIVAVMSGEVVLILLGPDWTAATPAVTILAFGMLFRSSYRLSDSLTRAVGAMYRRAWRTWLFAATVVLGSVVGSRWGLEGVSWGVVAALAVNFLLMTGLGARLVDMPVRLLVRAHVPGAVLGIVSAATTLFVADSLRQLHAPVVVVALLASVGATVACVVVLRTLAPRGLLGMGEASDVVHTILSTRFRGVALALVGPPRRRDSGGRRGSGGVS